MHINDLPPEVFCLILDLQLLRQYSHTERQRNMLSLLSVCRKWRMLGLWLAYKHVYLEYVSNRHTPLPACKSCRALKSSVTSLHESAPSDQMCSNLGLVPDAPESLPRKLTVVVRYNHDNIISTLNSVLDILDTYKMVLRNVARLKIDICCAASPGDQRTTDAGFCPQDIDLLAKKFVVLVPKISSIRCADAPGEEVGLHFLQSLTRIYAHQLSKIISSSAILARTSRLSENIAVLYLSCESWPNIPRVPTSRLKRVVLLDVPDNSIWKLFGKDSSCAGKIEFPCLDYLDIGYTDIQHTASTHTSNLSSYYTLSIPNLKSLSISLCSHALDVLKTAEFPQTIASVTITGTQSSSTRVCFSNLKTNTLIIQILQRHSGSVNNHNNPDLVGMAAEVLGIQDSATRVSIVLTNTIFAEDVCKFGWKTTTVLVIASPITFTRLMKIISQLPCLVELEAQFITIDEDFDEMLSEPVCSASKPADPCRLISKSLRYTLLGFNDDTLSSKKLEDINAYLRQAIAMPTKIEIF